MQIFRFLTTCRGFNLTSSRLGVGALTKCVACRMDACLILGRLLYIAPSSTALILHMGIEVSSAEASGK
jgi:hypothetical protein